LPFTFIIKVALKEKRKIWLKNGKPNDSYQPPTDTEKTFRIAVRIEVAHQKEIEKSKYNGGLLLFAFVHTMLLTFLSP
jgi:hypothetical protein